MSGRSLALGILLGTGLVAGGMYLLGVEFSDGSVYPEYSSLRSDPVGAKLLFDTLARVPGLSVTRDYLPLEYVPGTGATVFLLDLSPDGFSPELLQRVDQFAGRGNRVVATMAEVFEKVPQTASTSSALAKTWHVRLGFDDKAPSELKLYFSESTGWTTLEQVVQKPRAIERAVGKGSVVLYSDSSAFGNSALAEEDSGSFSKISTAIGPNSRIVFDEQHFGITQTGSVVGLVRRFRLTGMALGLAICAALLIWRNVTAFPPVPSEVAATPGLSGRTSRSGLFTLLRRHIPPSELASICWKEWLASNRRAVPPNNAALAEEIIRKAGKKPAEALHEIQSILHSKGTL